MVEAVVFVSFTFFTGVVVQFAPGLVGVNCNVTLIVVVLPALKNSPLVTLPVRLTVTALTAFTVMDALVVLPLAHLIVWVPVRTVLPGVSLHLVDPCAVDVNVPDFSAPVQFLRAPLLVTVWAFTVFVSPGVMVAVPLSDPFGHDPRVVAADAGAEVSANAPTTMDADAPNTTRRRSMYPSSSRV